MKGSVEIKKAANYLRKLYGKKNGNVPGWAWDIPELDRKDANSKKNYSRKNFYIGAQHD